MSMLSAALAAARKGFPVFPVHRTAKKPALKGWPDLATTDEDAIRKWWARWPHHNVGIHGAGLLIIDVDGPEGHEHAQRLAHLPGGLPDTLSVISGNRKEPRHYARFYRWPLPVPPLNKPLHKYQGYEGFLKIDVKSDRGFYVAPGSIHPTGGYYVWADESIPVALAPEWAVRDLATGGGHKPRPKRQRATEKPTGAFSYVPPKAPPISPPLDPMGQLVDILVCRWPLGPSNRNCQMTEAVCWLMATRRFAAPDTIRAMTSWYERQASSDNSPLDVHLKELLCVVGRTADKLARGELTRPPDHDLLRARLELSPHNQQILDSLCRLSPRAQNARVRACPPLDTAADREPAAEEYIPPTSDNLPQQIEPEPVQALCRLSQWDRRLLEVLLVHCQYQARDGRVLMTDRQLMEAMKQRFGKEPALMTFYSLKRRFIKAEGRPAPVCPVLELVTNGRTGVPSEYRLIGPFTGVEEGPRGV